jgi:hypothetical protein
MQQVILDAGDVGNETDELALDADEELIASSLTGIKGDIGSAALFPRQDGRRVEKGRPSAIRAWMFNGTETLLPLAYDPSGKVHDGARKYLRKRHCLCCHAAGFLDATCKVCIRNRCDKCNGKADPAVIIRCFYLKKEDVPFPVMFYGDVDCFLPFCVRQGQYGFMTSQEMRIHAASIHKMEYQAHIESQQANKNDEIDNLKARLDTLMGVMLQGQTPAAQTEATVAVLEKIDTRTPEEIQAAKDKMAHARAAKSQ